MKLGSLCYLIATNCCKYISELQIFCTDKNFDCLSATHKRRSRVLNEVFHAWIIMPDELFSKECLNEANDLKGYYQL